MITKKNKGYIFLVGILILFSLNFVSAIPPVLQDSNFATGYEIEIPFIGTLKQNQDFTFNFHLFNQSNGYPIDNSSTNCYFDLYNSSGVHLIETIVPHENSIKVNEWELKVLGGNFSSIGQYGYIIQCNSSTSSLGGVEEVGFEVTLNGEDFTTAKSISYLGFILICVLLLLTTIYGGIKVKWKHPKDRNEQIIGINNFRYIKVFLFTMAYFEAMFLFGLSYKFFNEGGLDGFTEFFNFIYQMFLNLMFPIMIVMIVIMFAIWINNKNLSKKIKLGL
jgi:hypothetical protein